MVKKMKKDAKKPISRKRVTAKKAVVKVSKTGLTKLSFAQ
jgi:hypothetical protein